MSDRWKVLVGGDVHFFDTMPTEAQVEALGVQVEVVTPKDIRLSEDITIHPVSHAVIYYKGVQVDGFEITRVGDDEEGEVPHDGETETSP